MQRVVGDDYSRPATFPVDYSEGIGYDKTSVGSMEPRSLYEAQLAIRLGEPPTSGGEEPPVEIIVDNGGAGASYTGSWKTSGGAKPYGKSSVYSRTANSRYKFSVEVPRADQYDVYLWWTTYASRVTQVPVEIRGSDGQLLDTVLVNQRFDGGQWNYIGTWELNGAASIAVVSTTSQGSTCADAVRVVTGQPIPPLEVAPLLPAGGIVDNGQDGTWSMGKWKISGALHPYGRNSLSASEEDSVYAYRLSLPKAGKYDVSLWWTTESDRGSRVPVEVTHAGGTTTVYVDQRQGGGKWNYVGTWEFGSDILVRIVSDGLLGSTCADAVRIRRSTRLLRPLGLQHSP
jgi:hypothetical protein